jgi:putative transposase
MPRRAGIIAAGYPMHLILRGIDRAAVFFEDADRQFFLDHLAAVAAEESVAVHAYVLMTNHLHLLMTAARNDGVGCNPSSAPSQAAIGRWNEESLAARTG